MELLVAGVESLSGGFEEGQIVDLNGKILVPFFEIAWEYHNVHMEEVCVLSLVGGQVNLDEY